MREATPSPASLEWWIAGLAVATASALMTVVTLTWLGAPRPPAAVPWEVAGTWVPVVWLPVVGLFASLSNTTVPRP